MRKTTIALLIASFALSALPTSATTKADLEVTSVNVRQTQVEGARGAALAVAENGALYLGGGERGETLFRYQDGELTQIGKLYDPSERLRDSRFGPTDVAVLKEDSSAIDFLISFPQLDVENRCVRLVAFRYTLELATDSLSRQEQWFQGRPCVPVGAVQHAAGRIEVIDENSAYITTGDLGFSRINDREARGWLGGIFRITKGKTTQLSQGHRNPQGILLIGKSLYISEHGPRGGDEINLIERGKDYGWPFVTFGEPYSSGDYVRPDATGTHRGFTRPLVSWVPSVAPTELVRLPKTSQWGDLGGSIVMGTLAEESLIFLERRSKRKISEIQRHFLGERIRDLEIGANGEMIATTDSGKLLFISRKP